MAEKKTISKPIAPKNTASKTATAVKASVQKDTKPFIRVKTSDLGTRAIVQGMVNADGKRSILFNIINMMLIDPTTISIVNSIVEDATVPFEDGRIFRAVGDEKVQNYVNQLLVNFRADEKARDAVLTLICFGEIYAECFSVEGWKRKQTFFQNKPSQEELDKYSTQDSHKAGSKEEREANHLVARIDLCSNPLEFYDVRFLGETVCFYRRNIQAAVDNYNTTYQFTRNVGDVFRYSESAMVHKILYPNAIKEKATAGQYDLNGQMVELNVERGKGLLEANYPAFVDLQLAKAAMLMARDARSVVVNLVKVQCQDMTDEEAEQTVDALLEKMSVKRAMNPESGITEYTNSVSAPAVVVAAKKGETGDITAEQIGGDYDPGQLTDIDLLENTYFGGFHVIKQEFGRTKDSGNLGGGGEALAEIKNRKAKMIETIHTTLCEMWKEVFNRYFESRGLHGFVNQFEIKMTTMTTQEQVEAENMRNTKTDRMERMMNAIVSEDLIALELMRAMCNDAGYGDEVMEIIDKRIADLKEERNLDEEGKPKGADEEDAGKTPPAGSGPILDEMVGAPPPATTIDNEGEPAGEAELPPMSIVEEEGE
jgi:hypothetical protein